MLIKRRLLYPYLPSLFSHFCFVLYVSFRMLANMPNELRRFLHLFLHILSDYTYCIVFYRLVGKDVVDSILKIWYH